MGCLQEIVDGLESLAMDLMRHRVVEVAFRGKSCRLVISLQGHVAHPCRDAGRCSRDTPRRGDAEENDPSPPLTPETRRCVLLRSPAVGVWRPALADGEMGGGAAKSLKAGAVRTILGDEQVALPREGQQLMELAGEGSLVGYGAPLALWEVD